MDEEKGGFAGSCGQRPGAGHQAVRRPVDRVRPGSVGERQADGRQKVGCQPESETHKKCPKYRHRCYCTIFHSPFDIRPRF